MLINREINDFYSETSELDRLRYGLGPLEFERNKDIISRYLPQKAGTILDVGGGPGVYSSWLAQQGFDVHLIDPVEKHIDQARSKANKLKHPFTSHLGEAGKLDFGSNFADLIIFHGPLYHLQDKKDRIKALKEANRVLKANGIILAFAINYTASTLVGLIQGVLTQPEFYQMSMSELQTGIHEAPKSMAGVLPKGYYHRPEELKAEVEEAGFSHKKTLPVEGLIWLDKNYFETRSDQGKKDRMMTLLLSTENDPNLLVFSPHIVSIGEKNE
ncbi:MAG: methyltransferase domain-containing protein [Bacteroidales bacterium]|nr:methyltransferase domain-containing protein [Bacteroidales bacterium]